MPVKAGPHDVGVSFVRRLWEPEGVLQPPQRGFGRTTNEFYHGNPAVDIVSIGGPYGQAGRRATRRAAGGSSSAARSARRGRRAVRAAGFCDARDAAPIGGRSTEPDVQTLLEFYKTGAPTAASTRASSAGSSASWPRRASCSAIEREPPGRARAGTPYRLERPRSGLAAVVLPLEQHSRRRAAGRWRSRGKLQDPAVLEQQVRRMLGDPRVEALVDNFAGQWLRARQARRASCPIRTLFREFDENLREALQQETEAVRRRASCARIAASSSC